MKEQDLLELTYKNKCKIKFLIEIYIYIYIYGNPTVPFLFFFFFWVRYSLIGNLLYQVTKTSHLIVPSSNCVVLALGVAIRVRVSGSCRVK